MPSLTVIIVTWNSKQYIEDCLASLEKQDYEDFSVIIIDNASIDDSVSYIREHYPRYYVLQNFKNSGYAKGNNQGIKVSKTEYVLIMSPDIILDKNFISKIMSFAVSHPNGGSFGGKLLSYNIAYLYPNEHSGGLKTHLRTDIIDSAGLVIYKNRSVANRGQGEKDKSQYEKIQEVFGI